MAYRYYLNPHDRVYKRKTIYRQLRKSIRDPDFRRALLYYCCRIYARPNLLGGIIELYNLYDSERHHRKIVKCVQRYYMRVRNRNIRLKCGRCGERGHTKRNIFCIKWYKD